MKPTPIVMRRVVVAVAAAGIFAFFSHALTAEPQSGVPATADARTINHVLNRLGFGPRPGDVLRVQAMGLAEYIDAQLDPARIRNAELEARLENEFETIGMSSRELAEKYFTPADQLRRQQQQQQRGAPPPAPSTEPMMSGAGQGPAPAPGAEPRNLTPEERMIQQAQRNVPNELMQAKMLRAATSERQVEEVLVDFWFNHFNVFIGKGQVRQYITEYEREAIRPYVLGNFRDMLGAVAHSPAMLFYLDNFQSAAPNPSLVLNEAQQRRLNDPRLTPQQRRQIVERQGMLQKQQPNRPERGLNENYARELMELHTLGVNGGYDQKDVIELARILTGWTIDRPQQGGQFVFRPQMHDTGTKVLLGTTFGAGGESEGERALDLLARHPSTARHISYKLAQRFVADEPPAALVERAASTFLSTKGNLRQVVRVIVTSPEFFAPEAYRAKVKTPFEFVVSAVRATGARIVTTQPMVGAMQGLGMPLYGCQPPTGYSMTADAWVNTGALLNRMNFAVQLMAGGRGQPLGPPAGRGVGPGDPAPRGRGPAAAARGLDRPLQARGRGAELARGPLQVDIPTLAPDTSEATRNALINTILAGQVSDGTRQTLARAQGPQDLVALVLGSPEFQRR